MTKSKIWLSSPHMGGSEETFVKEAFDTNWIAPLGPNVDAFEKSIEDYLGNDLNVAVLSSGTAAIHIALELLGVTDGDEVICQSFTFSASANPITYLGAKPVFVDSERETWNMSPQLLEKAILAGIAKGKKPKAIIAVHLYGMPYKVEEITAIADRFDIPIVEDSAEALGSTYNNMPCGGFGKLGILSFNGNKIITTSGGGALVSKCP
ncbi:DegT/DnrJ/EryC1/StrS family aminotransferase, partial [Arenibacter lacus]|uniref:DegT/DnrJ/EryC1/StrS family aminotransferase n=1 Tax=Arenibacter lacus TaxID=2608629 RepID=UPI001CC78B7D